VGNIDIEALGRDRDQLWGEAATLEAQGASIVLDPALWPAAAEEQEKRRIVDTWEDVVENMPVSVEVREGNATRQVQIIHRLDGKELVRTADVLAYVLGVATGHQHSQHGKRLAQVMKRCGWQTSKSGRVSIAGRQVRGYWRDAPPAAVPEMATEWLAKLKAQKEWLFNPLYNSGQARDVHRSGWFGVGLRWERLIGDELFGVSQDQSGYWFGYCQRGLLGQNGAPKRFSTRPDARHAIERFAADGDGWEWIAWPD
jgi:hypothetical protein